MSRKRGEKRDAAIALYESGKSLQEVSWELDVSMTSVRSYLLHDGVELRPPGGKKGEKQAMAVALYEEHGSIRAVARMLRVTYKTVYRWLLLNDMPVRRRTGSLCRSVIEGQQGLATVSYLSSGIALAREVWRSDRRPEDR